MTIRTMTILTTALLACAAPLLAQRHPEERLHELRLQRMKEALKLDDEQAAAVAEAMEGVRRAQSEARLREREAFARLRTALGTDPVDQQAVREAMEAIERERETVARVRREHAERLKQRLTPEQQAKLMLFNRQFEQRLKELMTGRRGGPMGFRRPGMRRPGMGPGPRGMFRGPERPRGQPRKPDRSPQDRP